MASSTAQTDSLRKGVAGASIGFGVAALLAPNTLARTYGVPDPAPEYTYMARLWGSGLLVLGTLTLNADSSEARRGLATALLVMNVTDVLAAVTAKGMPKRTRLLAAATSAGFAAANYTIMANEG